MGSRLLMLGRIKAVLLLVSLGLGVWEGVFSPMDWAIRILAALSPPFRDAIYREATKGFELMNSFAYLSILALMVVTIGYLCLWTANFILKRTSPRESTETLFQFARHHVLFNVMAMLVLLCSLFLNMQVSFSNDVMVYSMDSIEILAPQIPVDTRLRLRLDFFCIRNAADFYLLIEKLHRLSEATGTVLPAFEPV